MTIHFFSIWFRSTLAGLSNSVRQVTALKQFSIQGIAELQPATQRWYLHIKCMPTSSTERTWHSPGCNVVARNTNQIWVFLAMLCTMPCTLSLDNQVRQSATKRCELCHATCNETTNVDSEVDHVYPHTFKWMSMDFLQREKERGFPPPTQFSSPQFRGSSIFRTQHQSYAEKWKTYHNQRANLRLLCKACHQNVSKTTPKKMAWQMCHRIIEFWQEFHFPFRRTYCAGMYKIENDLSKRNIVRWSVEKVTFHYSNTTHTMMRAQSESIIGLKLNPYQVLNTSRLTETTCWLLLLLLGRDRLVIPACSKSQSLFRCAMFPQSAQTLGFLLLVLCLIRDDAKLAWLIRAQDCLSRGRRFDSGQNFKNWELKSIFEHMKLLANLKRLDYLLPSKTPSIKLKKCKKELAHKNILLVVVDMDGLRYFLLLPLLQNWTCPHMRSREVYAAPSASATVYWNLFLCPLQLARAKTGELTAWEDLKVKRTPRGCPCEIKNPASLGYPSFFSNSKTLLSTTNRANHIYLYYNLRLKNKINFQSQHLTSHFEFSKNKTPYWPCFQALYPLSLTTLRPDSSTQWLTFQDEPFTCQESHDERMYLYPVT